jgi:predicted Ser/Thr protein kinase
MESAKRDEMVMELVEAALARPRQERTEYLVSNGSSPDVVAEVLERAEWEERMSGFLENPLWDLGAGVDSEAEGRRMGHYRIQEPLGRGGMGVVFKAVDEHLGRTVALKVISRDAGSDSDRRRFLREAKAASALNHPNIITIHEFNSEDGQDFIAMEYIEGKTLDKAVSPSLPLGKRLDYARQIAGALAKAHAAGIVHRDLKPGNIMVAKDGQVKVLDFGLAKQERSPAGRTEDTQTIDAITMHGALMGTPAYMSPEQVSGEEVDHRSDIFSFGIILYQMICGQKPFHGANAAAMLVSIAGKPHQPVREVNPAAPARLVALVDRCLEKKPEARLPSMEIAASELTQIQAALGERVPGHRFTSWMLAAVLAIAGVAGWFSWNRAAPGVPAAPVQARHSVRYALLTEQAGAAQQDATFHGGSKFRFRLQATGNGFLYLVNEGPGENGLTRFYVLMPRPGASAAVTANETRLTDWLVFDENPGVERMWVVWSEEPIRALDRAANGPGRGLVKDTSLGAEIQTLLIRLRSESSNSEGEIRSNGNTLGSLIELRHQ